MQYLFPQNVSFETVRAKNQERAPGAAKPGIPVDLASGRKDRAGVAAAGGGLEGGVAMKRGKVGTKGALEMVQQSTASMGK